LSSFAISCVKIQALIHLFVKVHTGTYRYQEKRKNLFGLQVKLPLVTTILTTKGKGNPAKPTTQKNN